MIESEIMTRRLDSLAEIAQRYDAVVLDQWGVLHDGAEAYPSAHECIEALRALGIRLAVLSNSGKRAAANTRRIERMGFDPSAFEQVMTAGEALWQDIASDRVAERRMLPLERVAGDATAWAEGLDIELVDRLDRADAILLMGLPDDGAHAGQEDLLHQALGREIPVLCTNPDRISPRSGGKRVRSPGALAHAHVSAGGSVRFYGKPHEPVFRALETALNLSPGRLLMVGDSLEHDIAGGATVGWDTVFVTGGLHSAAFWNRHDEKAVLRELAAAEDTPMPTYVLPRLS